MKIGIPNPFTFTSRQKTAAEVGEELQFHIDMLEGKFTQSGMPAPQAKAAAVKRFGNLDNIKNQCVNINRRNSLLRRMLKTFTIVLAFTGLSIIILASDYKVTRIGTMLILISLFGRLLLHARGCVGSVFPPRTRERSLSVINDTPKYT